MHLEFASRVKLTLLFINIGFCLFLSEIAFSEPNQTIYPPVEIVITASRYEQERDRVASSISVIDSATIERMQDTSLVDVLKSQPNLDVISTGTKGASTSVSIRGANPEHTLVLLDGIELNNPILPGRSYNFADLMLNNVDRIEILRGPQSTIYGSDALGGVINVISKKGEGPLVLNSSFEAGTHDSFVEQVSASAGKDNYNYAFSLVREDVAGISAADSRYGNSEKDGYENTGYLTSLGISPSEDTQLNSIFHAIDSSSELDNFGGFLADDINRNFDNRQYFWGTSLSSKYFEDTLKSLISYNLSDQSFTDNSDPDLISSELLRSKYQSRLQTVHAQFEYELNESIVIIGGAETQEEGGSSNYLSDGLFGKFENQFLEKSLTTNAYFLQSNFNIFEQLYLNSGIRIDQHTKFSNEITWRLAPTWLLKDSGTRLFSTLGTGFKAPSLFQLYSSYGNQELNPERSLAFDVGVEQSIVDNDLRLSLTYFHQNFDDLIDFDPNTFIFSNIHAVTNSGLESAVIASICEWAEINLGYTYLDASNDDTGSSLLRRSRNKLSATLNVKPSDLTELGLQTNYRSSRFDNDFSTYPATTQVLAGYTTVDLLARYKLSQNLELFARIENLFDKNYSEVLGYGTYGIGGFAGFRLRF